MATEQWHLRPPNPANPVVFFDVTIGGAAVGRVKMELWKDVCPKTAENFGSAGSTRTRGTCSPWDTRTWSSTA